ncbi:UNVERIFIED_CONTAM: hypothetical protein H355_015725 [Colinus virginianus]|nr:hypothetical protein H355_015725 [Colinus virginianus]
MAMEEAMRPRAPRMMTQLLHCILTSGCMPMRSWEQRDEDICDCGQPRKIEEIKDFLLTARRKDAK